MISRFILERCRAASGAGRQLWCIGAIVLGLLLAAGQGGEAATGSVPRLEVIGAVQDSTGRGIAGVRLRVEAAGRPLTPEASESLFSDRQGRFHATFCLPADGLPLDSLQVAAAKPSWQAATVQFRVFPPPPADTGSAVYQASGRLTLNRQATPALGVAGTILLAVLLLIGTGWLHPTLAATLGAALMLFLSFTLGQLSDGFFIISFDEAVAAIDLNVILVLLGLMLFAAVLKKTGLFQWLAYLAYTGGRGRVALVVLLFIWWTALISAFLDNLTTITLMAPLALVLAEALGIKPAGLLVPTAFAAGLGGTATLIGDPPNLIIGSYAGLTFGDFVVYLTPVMVLCLAAASGFFLFWYRRDYAQASLPVAADGSTPWKRDWRLQNRRLLYGCLLVLALMILFLCLQERLGMKPAITVLLGSVLLIALSRVDIAELLIGEIHWPSLLFLLALDIVVAGATETGLSDLLATALEHLIHGKAAPAIVLTLWGAALLSALVGSIPATITLLPVVASLQEVLPGIGSGVLWWALALGAGLGSFGSMPLDPTLPRVGYWQGIVGPALISLLLCTLYLLACF